MSYGNEELKTIVKEIIAPVFKQLGFKKKGHDFYRAVNDIGQAFNIQESRITSGFTFNMGLTDKAFHLEYFNKELPEFAKEVECGLRLRISSLKQTDDSWYKLQYDTDLPALKAEIETDLKDFIIPFYERYADPLKWGELFDKYSVFAGPFTKFRILYDCGLRKEAEDFLNLQYNYEIWPKSKRNLIEPKDKQIIDDDIEPTITEDAQYYEEYAKKYNIELKIKKP